MATFFGTDCPRATYVFATGGKGIVFTFTEFATDRVDRREINDFEAHLMNEGQLLSGVLESTVGFAVIDA